MHEIFGFLEYCGVVMMLTVALLALTLSKSASTWRIKFFEAFMTVCSLWGIFSVIGINPHYMATVLGYNIDEIQPGTLKSDTTTVLLLCTVVTVLQYVSPVRWQIQALTCVSTFPVYCVASLVLGGPESADHRGHQVWRALLSFVSLKLGRVDGRARICVMVDD